MKGGGWPGGGGRSAKGIPGRGGRRAEAPGWEGCGRREGQRGRQCWWVGHVGWGDPRLARAPGDEGPGAREAVRRKGVGLEGRPESARPPHHHCHTELPRAPQGGRSPRAFLSARPWTGGQRVWDPAGQDTRVVRWHLALSPRSRGPGSPAVAQRPGKRRQCQQPRGVSAALAGQCPLRCRPSHPERGERGAPPACAVPPQPASATEPRGAGGPGVQSVWVPA